MGLWTIGILHDNLISNSDTSNSSKPVIQTKVAESFSLFLEMIQN
jgi:hypothetical protein